MFMEVCELSVLHVSYSRSSSKGVYTRDYIGEHYRVTQADFRSLHNGSYVHPDVCTHIDRCIQSTCLHAPNAASFQE